MESNGRVRVFARVRPLSPQEEEEAGQAGAVELPEAAGGGAGQQASTAVRVRCKSEGSEEATIQEVREFTFDGVFPPSSTQEDIFEGVGEPVLTECLRGVNGTVFAYGQTGSGKTHSLLNGGRGGDAGLLPRLVAGLFEHIAEDDHSSHEVDVAALQVYNEQVDDLLHPEHRAGGGQGLAVQDGGMVPGLTWLRCHQAEHTLRIFSRARGNLVYAETNMNKASSRSHAVFQIRLTRHERPAASPGEGSARRLESTCARLSVVDLAGSERVKKSGVEGMQFKEATAINRSLLSLGNVVNALASKKAHVPLRDSKLTRILDGSIGGNCRTVLLVCASPSARHAQETMGSFEFASRAMCVEVNAKVNRYVVDAELKVPPGRRSRPPSAPRAPAVERREAGVMTEADEEAERQRAELRSRAEAAEAARDDWRRRAEGLERSLEAAAMAAEELRQAAARAALAAEEARREAERAGRRAEAEAARAGRAEEREAAALASLEAARREAEERAARSEERLRLSRADLEAAAGAALAAAAAAARREAEGLRRWAEGLEAEREAAERLAERQGAEAQAARAEQVRSEAEARAAAAALRRRLGEAEDLAAAAEAREAEVAEASRAELEAALKRQAEDQRVALAAVEERAAQEAGRFAAEREARLAAREARADEQRAAAEAGLRALREDLDGRAAELKRERACLHRRMEEQRHEFVQAEARWKQAKEDALSQESEKAAAQLKRANAAVKASQAREEELREANAKLVRRISERESREEDLQQISQQKAVIDELRWELEVRGKEILRLCQEQSPNCVRGLSAPVALPPLPLRGRRPGEQQPASERQAVPRGRSAQRALSETPEVKPEAKPEAPRRALSVRALSGRPSSGSRPSSARRDSPGGRGAGAGGRGAGGRAAWGAGAAER